MKSIKQIIREEINDFDWTSEIKPMKPEMKWLKDSFDNLKPIVNGNRTYYVDNERKPLFYYQNEENGDVYIGYDRIWSILRKDFGLNYDETQELIKRWLEETYNLRGFTPIQTWVLPVGSWNQPII